jgi:hypothetical protein
VFVYRGADVTNDQQITVCVADLAERIVDEISEANQDWRAIERHARKLVDLLAGLTRPTARR